MDRAAMSGGGIIAKIFDALRLRTWEGRRKEEGGRRKEGGGGMRKEEGGGRREEGGRNDLY